MLVLDRDIEKLEKAINELKAGKIGPHAARIRYYAALVSKSAIKANLPRTTSCRWDLTEAEKERSEIGR